MGLIGFRVDRVERVLGLGVRVQGLGCRAVKGQEGLKGGAGRFGGLRPLFNRSPNYPKAKTLNPKP